jgi:hypothetical protein
MNDLRALRCASTAAAILTLLPGCATYQPVEPGDPAGTTSDITSSDDETTENRGVKKRRALIILGAVAGALLIIDVDKDECLECFPVFP